MDKSEVGSDWTLFEYSLKSENKIIRKNSVANFNEKWNKTETKPVSRFAYRNRYFVVAVVPDRAAVAYSTAMISDKELGIGLKFPTEIVDAGETRTLAFKMFVGPQKNDLLKMAGPEFDKILVYSDWGWLDAISQGILWVLEALHKYMPSGWAIILVSLLIYVLMYPLTITSLTSMRKMQALQPKMAELKKKHAKSPEKMNQEVMEMYKQHNVNPLSGCLPMLLQMPIFVGLYQVLWRSIFLRGEGFLWMKDLSLPDRLFKLPINIPFLGEYFNILPILMAGTMFLQQKLNMSGNAVVDPEQQMQQKMMLYMMPIFLGFIFYNFSSGLNLYFVVFYTLKLLPKFIKKKRLNEF
jgi:YidC/Oxa1 family membrane protein insertase